MATPVEQITALYIGYFGRAPEPAGLNYWVGRLADGFSLAEIAESFSVQPEATTKYPYLSNPNLQTPASADLFITQVYMNLFNRAPDAEGLAYWRGELANGTDVGDFILNVISGAVTAPDSIIIENKVEVGVDFALQTANLAGFVYDDAAAAAALEVIDGVDATDASVDQGKAETAEYIATGNVSGGGVIGETFTLTTGLDQFVGTGNDDTFQGVAANIGAFDSIKGGAGNDTLNIIGDLGAATLTGVTIENIETVNLTGNTTAFSATAFGAEARQIWQISNAGNISDLTADQTAGFRNAAVSDDVEFDGITGNVALDNIASASTIWFEGESVTTVNVSGSIAQNANPAVIETLNLHDHTQNAAGTESELIETLNLSLSTGTNVSLSGEFDSLVTLNATGSNAGLTINLSGSLESLEAANFGSGADTVTADIAGTVDTAFNLGAGNDVFAIDGTGAAENTITAITLGSGNDTFSITTALSNIVDASEANFASGLITVVDFDADLDVFNVSGLALTLAAIDNTEIGNIRDAASLFDAVQLAADYINVGGGEDSVVFTYSGNTYLLASANNDFDANDGLVQLVGVNANELDAASFVS